MSDQNTDLWVGDLDESEIQDGLRVASSELRGWIENGFEQDLRKRAIQIAREKREGVYRAQKEREFLASTFHPDADLGEVEKANRRLSELLDLPHRNKAQEAEMQKLLKTVQGSMRKYSPSGKARD